MDRFKIYTEQLYTNCTDLIDRISDTRTNFRLIQDNGSIVTFEDKNKHLVRLTSSEISFRYKKISLYYRDNIIQFCTDGISYVNDVVYIPNFHDFSFYSLRTEDELFQLSTLIDIKYLTICDIQKLNYLREYFNSKHVKHNT